MDKKFDFEDEPCISVTIELEWYYDHDPGNLNGLPENCWPSSTECEIIPEIDYADRIRKAYALEAEQAILRFDAQIKEMLTDGTIEDWDREASESAAEDRAEGK